MYKIAVWLVQLFLIFSLKRTYINAEVLPKNGAYVLAGKHISWLDVLCYGVAVYPRKINFMAKEELFASKATAWLLAKLNAISVNRDNPGPSSLKVPSKLLKDGEVFGIFPSGTRATNVAMKLGVTAIARRSKAPIIPAVYIGPERFSWRFLFKRPRALIIFGDVIETSTLITEDNQDEKDIRIQILDKVDDAFQDLLDKGKRL